MERTNLEAAEIGRFAQEELVVSGVYWNVYRGRESSTGQVAIIKLTKVDLVA